MSHSKHGPGRPTIWASDLANYMFCPESERLHALGAPPTTEARARMEEGVRQHAAWQDREDGIAYLPAAATSGDDGWCARSSRRSSSSSSCWLGVYSWEQADDINRARRNCRPSFRPVLRFSDSALVDMAPGGGRCPRRSRSPLRQARTQRQARSPSSASERCHRARREEGRSFHRNAGQRSDAVGRIPTARRIDLRPPAALRNPRP